MDAEQIVKLAPATIRALLESRQVKFQSKQEAGRRHEERWPFAGTVEVWLPESAYGERHLLATLHNLSAGGLAMRTRRPIAADTPITLAIHEPEMSCYGAGFVRHCTPAAVGYLVGVEFSFEADGDATLQGPPPPGAAAR
ncbi:MAG: PilZ domain-containing protein [Phycisphaerales bacterium]|nr:PilZ domain-containing protein [Phycisphaerales bacterium]